MTTPGNRGATILCGTDFSNSATAAARVAAAAAKRLGLTLTLAHVRDDGGTDSGNLKTVGARLRTTADDIRNELGVEVQTRACRGDPDEQLVALSRELEARWLVVGSVGAREQRCWLLGSVAERVAQTSRVPVLVVRNGAALEAWALGNRNLRVVVGVEPTPGSRLALRWARELAAIGPCDLAVARIVWPAEHHPAGARAPIPLDSLHPELQESLLHELRDWSGREGELEGASFFVKPGWGRVDSHLTQLAVELRADLLVVGTHQRAGIARLWQGSVSRGALHGAPMSVACVPPSETALDETSRTNRAPSTGAS